MLLSRDGASSALKMLPSLVYTRYFFVLHLCLMVHLRPNLSKYFGLVTYRCLIVGRVCLSSKFFDPSRVPCCDAVCVILEPTARSVFPSVSLERGLLIPLSLSEVQNRRSWALSSKGITFSALGWS